jgi:hypothetical protein
MIAPRCERCRRRSGDAGAPAGAVASGSSVPAEGAHPSRGIESGWKRAAKRVFPLQWGWVDPRVEQILAAARNFSSSKARREPERRK